MARVTQVRLADGREYAMGEVPLSPAAARMLGALLEGDETDPAQIDGLADLVELSLELGGLPERDRRRAALLVDLGDREVLTGVLGAMFRGVRTAGAAGASGSGAGGEGVGNAAGAGGAGGSER